MLIWLSEAQHQIGLKISRTLKKTVSLFVKYRIIVELEDATSSRIDMSCGVLMRSTSAINMKILQVIRIVSLYIGPRLQLRKQCLFVDLFHPLFFELKLLFEHLIQVVVFLFLYLLGRSLIDILDVFNGRRYNSPSSVSSFALCLLFGFLIGHFLHILHRDLLTGQILVMLLLITVSRCKQLHHPMVLSLIGIGSPCHQYPLVLHYFHFPRRLVVL